MPVIDVGEDFPPFCKPDDIGTKLGATIAAVITSAHRLIQSTDRNAINIRLGGKLGQERTLSLNKTNTKVLVGKFGKDSDKWVGESIKLVRSEANNPQTKKIGPAIRVE
jgi:hypothetical protein